MEEQDKPKTVKVDSDDFYNKVPDDILQQLGVSREGFKVLFEKACAEVEGKPGEPDIEILGRVFAKVGIELHSEPAPFPVPGHPEAMSVALRVAKPIAN